ncbi:MAG: SPOR domain-containing protein [Spirochaetales bacterium]
MQLRSIHRLFLPLAVLAIGLPFSASANGWEGRAEAADAGALPGEGYYLASNAVPRNTVVEIINRESGERTEATVVRRLTRPGLLARVSPELAEYLGISEDERVPIRLEAVSVSGIPDAGNSEEQALSTDPDINPQAAAEREESTRRQPEVAELAPEQADRVDLPGEGEQAGDDASNADPASEPRPSELRDPAISTDRLRADSDDETDPVDDAADVRPPELPEMRDPREIDNNAEPEPRPERNLPEDESEEPEDEREESEDEPEEPEDEPEESEDEPEESEDEPEEPEDEPEEPEDEPKEPEEHATADSPRVLEDLLEPSPDDSSGREDGEREEQSAAEDESGVGELPVVDELSADSYYLQVSAHRSVEAAVRTVRSLESRYPLAVTEHSDGDRRLFRILVGPINRDERGALLIDLRSMGFPDAFVRDGGQS